MVAGGANSFLLALLFIESLSNNDGKGNEIKKRNLGLDYEAKQ